MSPPSPIGGLKLGPYHDLITTARFPVKLGMTVFCAIYRNNNPIEHHEDPHIRS